MKHSWLAVAAGFALALTANSANAAFILDGFTDFSPGAADGIVNYAVYDNLAGDFLTGNPGTTFVAQDGAAVPTGRYVYLYQVVNVNFAPPEKDPLEELHVAANASLVDSAGYLATVGGPGTVFVENPNNPINFNNARLSHGLAADPLDDDSAAVTSDDATINLLDNRVEWEFTMPAGGYGGVFYLTSDFLYDFRNGALIDASNDSSFGSLPTPTPVPGGIALLLSAVPGLAGWGLVRKVRARKSAE